MSASVTLPDFIKSQLSAGPLDARIILGEAYKRGYAITSVQETARRIGVEKTKNGRSWIWKWPGIDGPGASDGLPELAPVITAGQQAMIGDNPPGVPVARLAAATPDYSQATPPAELADAVQRWAEQAGLIQIFRVIDGEPQYAGTLSPREASIAKIKTVFGGGRFSAGTPQLGYVTLIVAGAGNGERQHVRPAASADASATMLATTMDMMLKSQAALSQTMQVVLAAKSDPLSSIKDLLPLLRPESSTRTPLGELLELHKAIREIAGDGGARIEGDDDDDRGRNSFGDRVFRLAEPFADKLLADMRAPQPARIAAPAVEGEPPAAESNGTEEMTTTVRKMPDTPLGQIYADIQPFLGQLLKARLLGKTPDDVAIELLERLPDEQYGILAQACASDTFVEDFVELVRPDVHHDGDKVDWLKKLAETCKSELADHTDDDGASEDPATG